MPYVEKDIFVWISLRWTDGITVFLSVLYAFVHLKWHSCKHWLQQCDIIQMLLCNYVTKDNIDSYAKVKHITQNTFLKSDYFC